MVINNKEGFMENKEEKKNLKADSSRTEVDTSKPMAREGGTFPITSEMSKSEPRDKTAKALKEHSQEEKGPVSVDFGFDQGRATIKLTHAGSDGGLSVEGYVNTDQLIDKLEQAVPGDWDKVPLATLKMVLRNYQRQQQELAEKDQEVKEAKGEKQEHEEEVQNEEDDSGKELHHVNVTRNQSINENQDEQSVKDA